MIGVIQEALLKHLLVQPRAVEAHRHGQLDVALQVVVRRRGVNAVRVKALIEHKALEHLFVVDANGAVAQRHRAQTEIAFGKVDGLSALDERILQIVQLRLADFPQMHFIHRQRHVHRITGGVRHGGADLAAAVKRGELHLRVGDIAGERQIDVDDAAQIGGAHLDGFDISLGHLLDPNRLPDAGGAGVIAAVRIVFFALLAAGLHAGDHQIDCVDHQQVVAVDHRVGDIQHKAGVAADVGLEFFAVDPSGRLIIHRFKVEQGAAAAFRQVHSAAVPDAAHEILVFNAGELAFGAERHGDLFGEFRLRLIHLAGDAADAEVEFKFPFAVEVEIAFAHEIGARIFAARDRIHHILLRLFRFLIQQIILHIPQLL